MSTGEGWEVLGDPVRSWRRPLAGGRFASVALPAHSQTWVWRLWGPLDGWPPRKLEAEGTGHTATEARMRANDAARNRGWL